MAEETDNIALPDNLKFEDALKDLEGIVAKLEGGELELEACLEQFQKGTKLARFCEGKLNETSRQLEILRKTGPTSAEFQPFEGEAE